jgi:hypothetical protein
VIREDFNKTTHVRALLARRESDAQREAADGLLLGEPWIENDERVSETADPDLVESDAATIESGLHILELQR